jgi:hypothetical protein
MGLPVTSFTGGRTGSPQFRRLSGPRLARSFEVETRGAISSSASWLQAARLPARLDYACTRAEASSVLTTSAVVVTSVAMKS